MGRSRRRGGERHRSHQPRTVTPGAHPAEDSRVGHASTRGRTSPVGALCLHDASDRRTDHQCNPPAIGYSRVPSDQVRLSWRSLTTVGVLFVKSRRVTVLVLRPPRGSDASGLALPPVFCRRPGSTPSESTPVGFDARRRTRAVYLPPGARLFLIGCGAFWPGEVGRHGCARSVLRGQGRDAACPSSGASHYDR